VNRQTATAGTTWEAPRWAKMESFVKDQALLLGLECNTEVEKGLLRERGRVSVRGDAENCREFLKRLNDAIADFNRR